MSQLISLFGEGFNFVITRPLGYILYWCYFVTRNYGLAILLFTFVTRIILFPLAVKQQKSSAEMVRLQPKLSTLQKKHSKDKQKLQEEQMKLYQEEGYNPLGGCLPMLVQMPILFGLYNVIYRPYTFILGLSTDTINRLMSALKVGASRQSEINLAHAIMINPDKIVGIMPHTLFNLKFDFLGLDLTKTPTMTSIYILIPIVCYASSVISTWMSMKMTQAVAAPGGPNTAGMNKGMIVIMPFISAIFSLQVPAGVGFYWICTNLLMMLQVFILNKFYNTKKLAEQSEIQAEKRRAKKGIVSSFLSSEPEAETQSEEQSTIPERIQQPKRVPAQRNSGKKSKKQLMEENRRRLSAAREQERKRQH